MKKRVLILSASAGSGHVRAAEALAKAFQKDERVEQVVNEDALQYTTKLFRDLYSKVYFRFVHSAPGVVGALYRASDEPWKGDKVRLAFDRLNTRPLVKLIRKFDPHITVCTHFTPAGIMGHLIGKGEIDAHLSIVVTDLDVHAMWLSRVFHRYFVATDEAKAYLEALGLPGERVTISGIPIDEAFTTPMDRAALRTVHGLAPSKPVILLSAGTLGLGPTEQVVAELKSMSADVQIVVACGRNEELLSRVKHAVQGDARFTPIGYTTIMHEWMKMADLFIGKPGGLTTAEALVSGLPMVIFSPIPGQEERNCDHLLEEGIAIKCNELATVGFKVQRLLSEPSRLAAMRENTRRLAHPEATQKIVNTLLEDHLSPLSVDAAQRHAMKAAAAMRKG